MSFPISPSNGQTAVLNGITYVYSSANTAWTRVAQGSTTTVSLLISGTATSTSTTTGALQVVGGVGVGGSLNVGGSITATSIYVGPWAVSTGSSLANISPYSGIFTITNTTVSISTNTGALQVAGGVGVGGNINVGGNAAIINVPPATQTYSGVLQVGTTLNFSDTNILSSFSENTNTYAQVILQNLNGGSSSSADFILNNNSTTGASIYGDFGINGTGYSGIDPFSDPNGTYLYGAGGTLSIGTPNAFNFKVATNNTVALTITPDQNARFVGIVTATNMFIGPWQVATGTVANSVVYSLTINNSGAGSASGSSFNGSSPVAISYNSIGAPSTGGTNATGTWNIVAGSALTATSAAVAYSLANTSTTQVGYAATANNVINLLTINSTGLGGASPQSYNGSGALTISYNTIGAPSTGGTNATGTWNIVAGSAVTATYAAVAYSLANTATVQVQFATSASTATSAAVAYSLANTSTTFVGSAGVAYSITNTGTTQVGYADIAAGLITSNSYTIAGLSVNGAITATQITITNTATSVSTNSGALQVAGGVGVGGSLWATQLRQTSASVAIGSGAGANTQSSTAVAIGFDSGGLSQGSASVAVGQGSGYNTQGSNAVAIGYQAGYNTQTQYAVAIGYIAGQVGQGQGSVALGSYAAQSNQSNNAVAVGSGAGQFSQNNFSVAIGGNAASNTQSSYAVAIGYYAGNTLQGANSIAIGRFAGQNNQPANSIVLNALGAELDGSLANSFYVAPIRTDSSTSATTWGLYYNPVTKEITTSTVGGNLTFANTVTITSIASSTSTTTGALQVAGGAGIGQNLYVGGTVYSNNTPLLPSTIQEFSATAGQTIFTTTNAYSVGSVQVYANGIALGNGDFTATNGTTITLNVARTLGDVIRVQSAAASVNAVTTSAVTVLGGTAGQLLYQSASGTTAFAGPGTAGQVLISQGTGAPLYQSTLTVVGSNVGIGTSSPGNTLTVNGTSQVTSSAGETDLKITNSSTNGRDYWLISGGSSGAFAGGSFGIWDNTAGATRLSVNSSGNITINNSLTVGSNLTVTGNAYATNLNATYALPANLGSPSWINLGTFTAGQTGNHCFIKVVTSVGYNASTGQQSEIYIHFTTSNGVSVDTNGFAGWTSFYITNSENPGYNVAVVANAAGVSATAFTIYYYQAGNYDGNGAFYTVETSQPNGTWVNSATLASAPASASSTVQYGTNQYWIQSNTTVTGNLSVSGNVVNPKLQGYTEVVTVQTATSAATIINLAASNIVNLTLNTSTTIGFINTASVNLADSIMIVAKQSATTGTNKITWPSSVKWPNGSAPALSTATNAIDVLNFITIDGGASFYGALSLGNLK